MNNPHSLIIFNQKNIRRHWDADKGLWYFSIVDVVGALTDSVDPQNYWKVLKNRLRAERSKVVTKCNQLKIKPKTRDPILSDI